MLSEDIGVAAVLSSTLIEITGFMVTERVEEPTLSAEAELYPITEKAISRHKNTAVNAPQTKGR